VFGKRAEYDKISHNKWKHIINRLMCTHKDILLSSKLIIYTFRIWNLTFNILWTTQTLINRFKIIYNKHKIRKEQCIYNVKCSINLITNEYNDGDYKRIYWLNSITFPVFYICIVQVHGNYIVINSNKYLGTYWYIDVLE